MRDICRLLKLPWPYRAWLTAALGLSLATILANVGLLALSGWFIAAMALAGISGIPINYHYPAAGIRALAILRTHWALRRTGGQPSGVAAAFVRDAGLDLSPH